MGSRKRTRSEAVAVPEQQPPEEPGMLQRLRNSWELANLMQYIAIFGKLMKIDEELEIEDLETECLKPEASYKLLEIGLCLLKWVSSHRGLTFDNFDEYTRRQYNAKAPHLPNPFGYDEEPAKFLEFDVFLKLRVLHQLSVWTFWNPDRIRDKMPEKKENDQTQWRIEEFGYDRDGRYYYVLDDNRLYRRTEPPIPAPQRPKKKPKSRSSRASRASRRRSSAVVAEEGSDEEHKPTHDGSAEGAFSEEPFKWECVAVSLPEYQAFLETIRKTKDADEKILRDRLEEHVLPLLEKAEEAQQRRRIKREKELLNMQLLAGAKRSSRLAAKEEKERAEHEAAEAARKRVADLAEARRDQARQQKLENERQSRMMTREQRIKDREQKRLLHEAELERIAAEREKLDSGEGRLSARNLQAEIERQQKNLAELVQEEEWFFDCSGCGVHGENLDDGSHSVACEKCGVWQHSKCLGISQEEAEKDDFQFVCRDCKRKEEEANLPKLPPLRFHLSASASPSSAPPAGKKRKLEEDGQAPPSPVRKTHAALSGVQDGPRPAQPGVLPPWPSAGQGVLHPPLSPERRALPPNQNPLLSSSPPRAPFSPAKSLNGMWQPSMDQHPKPGPDQHFLPPVQQAPPRLPPIGSFHAPRPASSHSGQGPIQNQPSMSPTQGNHDVGRLAGFPPTAGSNGGSPWTSFESYATPRPQSSGHGMPPSMSSNYPSFSSATPNGHHSSPPQSSHGMSMSGISPIKQSPRPGTSGGMAAGGAPVLPPIRRLDPSPKLMGRSSPDAPIPPPVKCMTPEQEERRQRENAWMLQQNQHGHGYPGNGQPNPMSSPSLNRFPSLGPPATFHQTDSASPQRGGNGQGQ